LHIGPEFFREDVEGEAIIGSGTGTGRRLAIGSDLEAEHALLAYFDGAWYLHDLVGDGLARISGEQAEEPAACIRLAEGDVVGLGPVEMTFRLPADAGPLDDDDDEPMSTVAEASTGHYLGIAETLAALAPAAANSPVVRDSQVSPVYRKGAELCLWLRKTLREQRGNASALLDMKMAFKSLVGSSKNADPLQVLEGYERDLARAPRNRDLLLSLARFFEEQAYYDLCGLVLIEVHHLTPRDVGVLRSIAEVCRKQAVQPDLPAERSLTAFATAGRYLDKALQLAPRDHELIELHRALQAERTIRQGNYDAKLRVRGAEE
jgi:hypothetical protein